MKFLSFGAGAIGTYIGGSLALSEHEVVFLERASIVEELQQKGLTLQLPDGKHRLRTPKLAASLAEALEWGPYDAALFALKSFDTQAALEVMQPYAGNLPPVICLQNGVENEAMIAAALGEAKVIPATVTSAIGRRATGDIVLERLRGVGLAAGHALSLRLYAAFNEASLRPRLYANVAAMKWSKLLTNLLANASSAILNMTPGEIFAHPGLFRLEMAQLREALAVMQAQQIPVVDLPGAPARLLALGASLPTAIARLLMQRALGSGRGGKMPSFYIDLHSGRGQSEVEYLNGAVARFGRRLGIPTPVNEYLTQTLLALTRGELPLDAYAGKAERLLEEVGTKINGE
jgi:2-dehydropantoate 2-reductase